IYTIFAKANELTATFTATGTDVTPPITTDNAPKDWQNATVTVTLTATDPTPSSGVARTYYSVNQGTWTVGTAVIITNEGTNTLAYYSVDNAGNTETTKICTIYIDNTQPITTDNAPTGWQNTNVVTLTPGDSLSGVATTYYSLNQGSWIEGISLTIPDATNTVSYYSVDNAGNIEATKTKMIQIDKTQPTTTDDALSGWHNSDTVITLTAADPLSGVAQTYYTTDGSTPTTSSATGTTISLTDDGMYTIKYFSMDNAGNAEAIKTATNIVMLDKTPPVTGDNAPSSWQPSTVTVTLITTDTLSGVAKTYYTTDGSTPTTNSATGTIITLTTDGTYTIKYFSIDSVNNAEAIKTAANIVKIDKTPPVIIISTPANGAILLSTQTTVTGSITDISMADYGTLIINGIASTLDITGDSFTGTATLCYGKNTVIVVIVDKAGNAGSATLIIEVVTAKVTIPSKQTGEIETTDGTKMEILKNYMGTMTPTINNSPKEANFAVADQNLPSGVDISQLAETVREFKLFDEENATVGTTTGKFKITIPYPATIPDDKAKDLRIFWMDPSANSWKLIGGTVDTANYTVTIEVDHLSIYRVAFYTFIASNLSNIRVYPNPFNDNSANSGITIDQLSENVTIKIFNIAGELVDELSGITGKAQWDAKNSSGEKVASGIYIYLAIDKDGRKATGKVAIIR
ncbi:chitobiase/beta-hexosaminidase C-terminal domain-containing protein, partial [Candidatus Desantisbacteria bacterium]|nr:chitobiase/beta-hexosaminidase C-terminal domain-containing protein [Candidatus Desantisbacteria bacterium]